MKKKLTILSILALCSTLLLAWCKKTGETKIIQEWDTVTISYDSYLLDWEIIEENTIQNITIWENNSFPIFDTELIGLKSGDTKEFTTKDPKEWYGIAYNNFKIQKISTSVIDTIWADPKIWEQINLWSLNGVILEISPVDVTIDFNDRQTRENVEFHVTVLDIERDSAE
jgi:FKBP-type peptidyl-prolyl cis-trans isomerase 2